ncbi:MAG: hypothetical protein EHM19_13005, partial [Candidatus Latescibacterota bacterium]
MSVRGYLLERTPLEHLGPMPRREARQKYQRYLTTALLVAAGFHLATMAGGIGIREILNARREATQATKTVKIVPYRELGAPPALDAVQAEVPKFGIAAPKLSIPAAAIPIPVPEELATSTTIASQEQMPFAGTEGDTGLGDTTGLGGVDWGDEDGGDPVSGLWDATNSWPFNAWPSDSYPTTNVLLPAADRFYYYRYYATNVLGADWPTNTEHFLGGSVWVTAP